MGMRHLQTFGLIGSFGGYISSLMETANIYLQFISLLLGVVIGIWALYDKIQKRCNQYKK